MAIDEFGRVDKTHVLPLMLEQSKDGRLIDHYWVPAELEGRSFAVKAASLSGTGAYDETEIIRVDVAASDLPGNDPIDPATDPAEIDPAAPSDLVLPAVSDE
jgi:hypothetical protein